MQRKFLLSALAAMPLQAEASIQSALHPSGKDAFLIADIGNLMFIGGAAIFAAVMLLAALAVFGPARMRRKLNGRGLVIAGGIAFPVIVLSALLVYALLVSARLVRASDPADVHIEVVGELWWWRVRYLDPAGNRLFETANEIRLPAGRIAELTLTTADVIHSFWVPNLAGKTDMIPGHVNKQRLHPSSPGTFRGLYPARCHPQVKPPAPEKSSSKPGRSLEELCVTEI